MTLPARGVTRRTIETQVGIDVERNGHLNVAEHIGPDGVRRALQVRLLLDQCDTCGALLLGDAQAQHLAWHASVVGMRDDPRDTP